MVIGGDKDLSLRDLQSLLPTKYHEMLTVVDDKIVMTGYDKLPDDVKSYEGVALLNSMIISRRKYSYSVSNVAQAIGRTAGEKYSISLVGDNSGGEVSATSAILNLSRTDRGDLDKAHLANSLPDGFDGSVTIRDGSFSRVNAFDAKDVGRYPYARENIVFHELKENLERTEGNGGMD